MADKVKFHANGQWQLPEPTRLRSTTATEKDKPALTSGSPQERIAADPELQGVIRRGVAMQMNPHPKPMDHNPPDPKDQDLTGGRATEWRLLADAYAGKHNLPAEHPHVQAYHDSLQNLDDKALTAEHDKLFPLDEPDEDIDSHEYRSKLKS